MTPRQVVLVGAGHTHVQVLAAWAMDPPRDAQLTLVVDAPLAVYSGMVPGLVEERYLAHELEIDAVPLARRARARVVLAAATGIDPIRRTIEIAGRPALPYDVASLDIGASVAGLELPGIREFALPTRPIGRFASHLATFDERVHDRGGDLDVVVVGGGAGGIELAATLRARARGCGYPSVRVRLIQAGPRLLPERNDRLAQRLLRELGKRDITVETGLRVVAADAHAVSLDDGSSRPCDVLVWVVGAHPQPNFDPGDLELDQRGFVLVEDTLEVCGQQGLFAVGDCASLRAHPWVPKAGVYAVRSGPILIHNLRAVLDGSRLRSFRPQRHFLTLINLGEGVAVGERNGVVLGGRWVMGLKDKVDRRFVERFRRLAPDGTDLQPMASAMPAICGGCAAKLGPEALSRVLAQLQVPPPNEAVVLGLEHGDDVVAWRAPAGDVVVGNVELMRAFGDDPFLVGWVAAANTLSDLDAKGVRPRFAQAIIALPLEAPESLAERILTEVLAGALAAFGPRKVELLGGHTARAAELMVGFAVEGVAEAPLRPRRGGIEAGDVVLLTRALGTGVLLHADMAGRARGPWVQELVHALTASNQTAAEALADQPIRAMTDVTGFGLIGHLLPMLQSGGVSARIELGHLPALPGALELLAHGERSTFHWHNERLLDQIDRSPKIRTDDPRLALAFDPQTAGGLLMVVPAGATQAVLATLALASEPATVIGSIEARASGRPIVLG